MRFDPENFVLEFEALEKADEESEHIFITKHWMSAYDIKKVVDVSNHPNGIEIGARSIISTGQCNYWLTERAEELAGVFKYVHTSLSNKSKNNQIFVESQNKAVLDVLKNIAANTEQKA